MPMQIRLEEAAAEKIRRITEKTKRSGAAEVNFIIEHYTEELPINGKATRSSSTNRAKSKRH